SESRFQDRQSTSDLVDPKVFPCSSNALLICAAVVVDFCATMSASECTKRNVDRCVKWSKLLCIWPITRHLEMLPKILFQLQLTGGRRDSSRQASEELKISEIPAKGECTLAPTICSA